MLLQALRHRGLAGALAHARSAPPTRHLQRRRIRRSCSSTVSSPVLSKWEAANSTPSSSAKNEKEGVAISSAFDSGNIEVVSMAALSDIQLRIHSDPYCESDQQAHGMWFNYRVTGVQGRALMMRVLNAGECSYPAAWEGYRACASYDLEHWFRVPTTYHADAGVLTIEHTPECSAVQYAYFAPYTYNKHRCLVAKFQAKPGVKLHLVTETVDGHDLDLLQLGGVGPAADKRKVWVIARQHPGEAMAEWFMEGLLERLTDPTDAVCRRLLQQSTLYLVPNMCPDGTWRGHLRTGATGRNFNREWAAPDREEAPEVFSVLKMMEREGVDMLVDVHGDEELPAVFLAGAEGISGWSERLQLLQGAFSTAFRRASPDFQTALGYAVDAPNQANMSICSNQIAQKFDCLAVTLEMPFKDTADCPDELQGWSPERARHLGADMLTAVYEVLPLLRD